MANVIYYPDKNEIKDKDYKEPQIPELKTNKDKENIRSFVAKNRSSSRLKKGIAVELYVTDKTIARKSKQWLAKIHPYNQHEMALNPDKSALIVIDMQKFFLDAGSPTFTCGGPAILPTLRRVIGAFRKAGRPVIFTRHVHHPDNLDSGIMQWWWEGMCLEGSPESEIHPDLAPALNEKVIFKHRYSSFYNTDLETVLRCLRVEDLVVSGIMTNLCCESTARDAYYRDYRVFVLADGTGTINEEMHQASLLNLAFGFAFVTTADKVVNRLNLVSSPE
ncbi:MAG: cysteine hydrolase [Candidatus Marinimicrobia bacterium]|nr:cysteine hydrolase [Candidatus Neomarinimicrobiota bacterium]